MIELIYRLLSAVDKRPKNMRKPRDNNACYCSFELECKGYCTTAGVPTINCKKYCGLYKSNNKLNSKKMDNSLNVNVENVQKAFKEAGNNPEIQTLLINLFGKENVEVEQIDNRPITERIKTFEDAVKELGEYHPTVAAWNEYKNTTMACESNIEAKDITAYLKLHIICAALNEGWKPQFTEDEWRYHPWFYLYTQKEIDEMDEDERCRVVSDYVSSSSNMFCGSGLAFRSEQLAKYAGRQFVEIFADFLFKAE